MSVGGARGFVTEVLTEHDLPLLVTTSSWS